ncbi:molt-inhibiting hormone-like [Panulirus ornatus]|uniref:molt-inhibiting hormone-like n=1 Tax=Panulirus ornatus TaxID=150431 RepID=UPI003A8847E0
MKAPQATVPQMVPSFSLQRVWLLLLVALVGSFLVEQSSARYVFNECPGIIGNRDLYSKVERVCRDCYNLFRDDMLEVSCRKDCFVSRKFGFCLVALFRSHEHKDFHRWISILNAGRK